MRFEATPLAGTFIIHLEPHLDERGAFARTFASDVFASHGLESVVSQANASANRSRGTIRGMHYQIEPMAEAKLVRVTRGSIYDVVIDLRRTSDTYMQWFASELSEGLDRVLYVPKGLAHGFQTLVDDSEVTYLMSTPYSPAHQRGLRWNDPAFAIPWPIADPICSPRDQGYPDFDPAIGD